MKLEMAMTSAGQEVNHPAAGDGSPQLNLSMLTDFLLQKTYHEIMVLSELLPRKSDIERKIEIIQFASRTRQQFIRLLALVKWASNSKQIHKCQAISTFLDQQTMHFIDTADMLARMSRETLVQARLPNFSLPTAIDVLTTGTFKRLPRCIKDRVIPAEPITQAQVSDTYTKLNLLIKHRLASSKLPPQFSCVSVGAGRLKLSVENEFEVTLTVMGPELTLPWRILKIAFLIQDFAISEGKPLVHGMQTQYVHSVVQSRVMANNEPLVEIYNCLHYFSLSLQLEVFHMQARKLILERWIHTVKIEAYITGQKMCLSYWRKQSSKRSIQESCSIRITADASEKSLLVGHEPNILPSHVSLLASHLSIEAVLNAAIKERALYQLRELWNHLKHEPFFHTHCVLDEDQPCLLLKPSHDASAVDDCRIKVDMRTGAFHILVPDCASAYTKDLHAFLTGDRIAFLDVFNNVRCALYLSQIAVELSSPFLTPLSSVSYLSDPRDCLSVLSQHRLYCVVPSPVQSCVVLDVSVAMTEAEKPLVPRISVVAFRQSPEQEKQIPADGIRRPGVDGGCYVTAAFAVDLDSFTQYTPPLSGDRPRPSSTSNKRKPNDLLSRGDVKSLKSSDGVRGERRAAGECGVAAAVTFCCQRLPFVDVFEKLTKANIPVEDVRYDPFLGHVLRLLDIPRGREGTRLALRRCCSDQFVRMDKALRWTLEMHFKSSPVAAGFGGEIVARRMLGQCSGSELVTSIADTWAMVGSLYDQASELALYGNDNGEGELGFSVKSFDFLSLEICYGPARDHEVKVTCDHEGHFTLAVAMTSTARGRNPHEIVRQRLTDELNNSHRNLAYTVKTLNSTLVALQALNTMPVPATLGTTTRLFMPLRDYTILPQSSTHFNILYRDCFILEAHVLEHGVVLKDGSYSKVDAGKSVNNFYYLHQLRDFLALYCDKSTVSRFHTETDYPDQEMSPAEGIPVPVSSGDNSQTSFRPVRSPAMAATSPSPFTAPSPGGGMHSVPSPGTFLQPSSVVSNSSPGGWPASPLLGVAAGSKTSLQSQRHPPSVGRSLLPMLLSTPSFCSLVTWTDASSAAGQRCRSPLDRYFGAIFFRRHLTRVARTDETLRLEKADPLVFHGNPVTGLQYTVLLNPSTRDSLCLKVAAKQGIETQLTHDEMRLLEMYFENKVACPPYKAHALTAFARLLGAHGKLLRDCIRIMLLELKPDVTLPWRVEWCFTVPMSTSNFVGTPAVVLKAKSLFFFNFVETRVDRPRTAPLSLVYVPDSNTVQTFEFPRAAGAPPEVPSWELSMHQSATSLLQGLGDRYSGQECTIYNAVVHLLTSLSPSPS